MAYRRKTLWCKTLWMVTVALVVVGLTGCDLILGSPSPSPTPQPPPTAAPPPPSSPTPAPTITSTGTDAPVILVLELAEVADDLPAYDRRHWRHWRDADRDCQDARQEVLVAESFTPVVFKSADECRVESGSWVGPYTGIAVSDPSKLDVDHMVPLANAHRSGASGWSRDRKADYANNLDYADHLIATTRSANRSKGSDGPEDWRPPDETYWCDYAIDWSTIKSDWGLTATAREADALRQMLETCPESVILETG